jgi:hypothetical protein
MSCRQVVSDALHIPELFDIDLLQDGILLSYCRDLFSWHLETR